MAEYIKREDVEKVLIARLEETALNNTGYMCDAGEVFLDAADRIRLCWLPEIPAEDVRPVVRGEWVPSEYPGHLTCSNCHDAFVLPDWPTETKWRFCPQCGADMRGGGGDE